MKGFFMKAHTDKNDETLVELTLLGDKTAYEELVLRHQRAVMGTAYKMTGNRYSAEDASQDAFVSAWMNLSELRDGAKFGSWVCAFAKNCARTLERRYRAAIPAISLDESVLFDVEDTADVIFPDEYEDIHAAVDALSDKIREAVRLHYFEEMSVAEIAKMLSVPVGTVKWRLSEGRKQLRKGYGIMEKTYNESESLVTRVMRQVEELKLWGLKNNKTGFEEEYREVLCNVEALEDSKEKSAMLADTLLRGYWWIPGEKNDEVFARIKKAADDGHNEGVMMSVALKNIPARKESDSCVKRRYLITARAAIRKRWLMFGSGSDMNTAKRENTRKLSAAMSRWWISSRRRTYIMQMQNLPSREKGALSLPKKILRSSVTISMSPVRFTEKSTANYTSGSSPDTTTTETAQTATFSGICPAATV